MNGRTLPELGAMRRNNWVAALYSEWQAANWRYLDNRLRRPQIVLLDSVDMVGRWDSATRTLGISIAHIATATWCEVIETLRHEMAHQFVDEIEHGLDRSPHGAAFRSACERLAISSAATLRARPVGAPLPEVDEAQARLMRRIDKLLSLAESPNQNEASAAFQKARRLMIEHRLDPSRAPGRAGRSDDLMARYVVAQIGPIKGRHAAWEYALANLLEHHFFVETIWISAFDATCDRIGTVLSVHGTTADVEFARYVYDFLTSLIARLWDDYRKQQRLPNNRDRQRYFCGLLRGFTDELEQQDRRLVTEEGIVVAKDADLVEFFRRHHPRLKRIGGGSIVDDEVLRDGERNGRNIRIHRPIGRDGDGGFGGYLTS